MRDTTKDPFHKSLYHLSQPKHNDVHYLFPRQKLL